MKEKRKNSLDEFEPNRVDELAKNVLIAMGMFIGVFLLTSILLVLAYFATSALNDYAELEEIKLSIQDQCNFEDYRRYEHQYQLEQDYSYSYSDYSPDENLQIACERSFLTDDQWQCTCTESE